MCTPAPRLLAIDSSTETLHLALCAGPQAWFRALAGGAQASATVVPAILELLQQAGLQPRDLDAIAFGRGPGAFTGLRTACAVAQGLALGAGRPVLALDTLMAVAESAHALGAGDDVWAAQDARMGEIYAARYRRDPGGNARWECLSAPLLHDPDTLAQALRDTPGSVLAGNAVALLGAAPLHGAFGHAASDGPALLRLARTAWADGHGLDAALALPIYVRDKVAQTTEEREALKAAQHTAHAGV